MARLFLFTLLAFGITTFATHLPTRQNNVCATWCAANFASPGSCTSQAAQGAGPCYTCGPLAANPAQALCSGTCVDTSTSSANCGSCGNSCGSSACVGGVCAPACPPGQTLCSGVCIDTRNDENNCGSCGFVCPDPCQFGAEIIFCQQGTCGFGCRPPS
ncbi:uncharacterized protein EAF02_005240 [Botrytis sinoallii]|uniref:uncharacterized protein n=1 Tax=Botrytis sinoallii TaxID=1463999 RepID=UPI0018FF1B08|nr:uncharacterized protein EAF02_005240 [Botrytis sinoallii]KAF7883320.1 hypothetical protein EAF02_005240 [Botrytis sinoallii]